MTHVVTYKNENGILTEYTIAGSESGEKAIDSFMLYASESLRHLTLIRSEIGVRELTLNPVQSHAPDRK